MKITFLTVGGRTSAVVPEVQKKTGPASMDTPIESDRSFKKADHAIETDKSSKDNQTKKRRASGEAMPSKPPKGKRQHTNDISDVKEVNYDTVKSMLREELRRDLKEELLYELKQELKQEIRYELMQTQNAIDDSKISVSQPSSIADYQAKRNRDIEKNVAVGGSSRRRSARLNG